MHSTHTVFQLVVNICQDNLGRVWAEHDFLTSADRDVAASLPHGGVPQIAHALLSEAVFREVYTSALILMTRDPDFLPRWIAAEESQRRGLEQELQAAALHVLTKTPEKMLPNAISGILAMLTQTKIGQ